MVMLTGIVLLVNLLLQDASCREVAGPTDIFIKVCLFQHKNMTTNLPSFHPAEIKNSI